MFKSRLHIINSRAPTPPMFIMFILLYKYKPQCMAHLTDDVTGG